MYPTGDPTITGRSPSLFPGMQAPKGNYGKCLLLTVEKTKRVLGEVLAIARGIT